MENLFAPPQQGNISVGCKPRWQAAMAPGPGGEAKEPCPAAEGGGRDSLRKAHPPSTPTFQSKPHPKVSPGPLTVLSLESWERTM